MKCVMAGLQLKSSDELHFSSYGSILTAIFRNFTYQMLDIKWNAYGVVGVATRV